MQGESAPDPVRPRSRHAREHRGVVIADSLPLEAHSPPQQRYEVVHHVVEAKGQGDILERFYLFFLGCDQFAETAQIAALGEMELEGQAGKVISNVDFLQRRWVVFHSEGH